MPCYHWERLPAVEVASSLHHRDGALIDDVGVLQCGASGDERFFTILASEICRKISEFEGKPLLGLSILICFPPDVLLSWKAGLTS